MKTSVSIILICLILSIFGTAAGGLIIMLYNSCSTYIIGSQANLFSLSGFINGILVFYPVLMLFIPMFLVLVLIRHSSKDKLPGIITITILTALIWGLAVPFELSLSPIVPKFTGIKDSNTLSSGYFRKNDDKIFYFTDIDIEEKVSGLEITQGEGLSGRVIDGDKKITDFGFTRLDRNVVAKKIAEKRPVESVSLGFTDPLMKNSITIPYVLELSVDAFYRIIQYAATQYPKGIIAWLVFCSMILALNSVCAVCSCCSWRLGSAFYVVFATSVTIIFNVLFLRGFFAPLMVKIMDFSYNLEWLCQYFNVAGNLLITFIVVMNGIIAKLISSRNIQQEV